MDTAHTHGVPCSSFALRTHLEKHGRPFSSWQSRRSLFEQSGNSMHTSVSGVVFMYILTQVIMDQRMMFFQYASLMRRTMVDGKVFTSLTLRDKKDTKSQSSNKGEGSMQHTTRESLGDITDADRDAAKRRKMA